MAKKETKKPTFEQALERLETIVEKIESGDVSLEESIAQYEEGIGLVETCRGILDQAEKKIQLLAEKQDGQLAVEGDLDEPDDEDG